MLCKLREKFNKLVEKLYFSQEGNLALYDKLTGVYNYNWFVIEGAKKYAGTEVFIVVIDVNGFKEINDTKGHLYGNKILQDVAHQLSMIKSFDESVDVVRYGGDEFLIISNTDLTSLIEIYNEKDKMISYGSTKKSKDEHISVAFVRADVEMYAYKQQLKREKLKRA